MSLNRMDRRWINGCVILADPSAQPARRGHKRLWSFRGIRVQNRTWNPTVMAYQCGLCSTLDGNLVGMAEPEGRVP